MKSKLAWWIVKKMDKDKKCSKELRAEAQRGIRQTIEYAEKIAVLLIIAEFTGTLFEMSISIASFIALSNVFETYHSKNSFVCLVLTVFVLYVPIWYVSLSPDILLTFFIIAVFTCTLEYLGMTNKVYYLSTVVSLITLLFGVSTVIEVFSVSLICYTVIHNLKRMEERQWKV